MGTHRRIDDAQTLIDDELMSGSDLVNSPLLPQGVLGLRGCAGLYPATSSDSCLISIQF